MTIPGGGTADGIAVAVPPPGTPFGTD